MKKYDICRKVSYRTNDTITFEIISVIGSIVYNNLGCQVYDRINYIPHKVRNQVPRISKFYLKRIM